MGTSAASAEEMDATAAAEEKSSAATAHGTAESAGPSRRPAETVTRRLQQ